MSSASYWQADAGDAVVNVSGMAVGGSDLYFSVVIDSTTPMPMHPGALMHVSTYGGAVTQLADGYQFQTPVVTPTSVLVGIVDESALAGGILSVPRNGGSPTPLVVLPGDELSLPPVTDGTSVYFNTDLGAVEAVPLLTPVTSPTVLEPQGSNYLLGMGVFGQRLVLLHNGGRLDEIPIGSSDAGGEIMLGMSPNPIFPQSFISCGADACWIADNAVIEHLDPTSGAISALPGGPIPGELSFSFAGNNFFGVAESDPVTSANVTIERVPQQGGASETVAILPPSVDSIGGFAVDDACVYFTTPAGIYSLSSSATGVVVP